MNKRSLLRGVFYGVGILVITAGVSWAEYPDRPITLIANYPPGATADLSSRALAKYAAKELGKPIAVVNKPGASGSIGVGAIAAAIPDGYTIGVTTYGTLTFAPHIHDVPYNPLKAFDYIMGYGKYVYGLAIRADSPIKNLKELIEYAKANPGKTKYAIGGIATPENFGMIYLSKFTGAKWEGVIFKGAPEANTAVLGGHVDLIAFSPVPMVQYVKAGRLRLLCSFDERRLDWAPEVPTVRELGYPFDVFSWLGLGAPKGVPAPILARLRQVFKKAMDDPEFKTILETMYMPVVYRSPDEYEKLVEEGYKTNEKMILELGLHKSQKKG